MSQTRELALSLLGEIERGKRSGFAIDQLLEGKSHLHSTDRGFISELVYGTLRMQGTLDSIIRKLSAVPIHKLSPIVLNILRLGLYQFFFMNSVPAHAALNESVLLAKKSPFPKNQKRKVTGFINAILRSAQRKKKEISEYLEIDGKDPTLKPKEIAFKTAHPVWLIKKWVQDFGIEKTLEICEANNAIPKLTVRVNPLKVSVNEFIEKTGSKRTSYSPDGVELSKGTSIRNIPGYDEGHFQVQGEASQLVTYGLDPKPGERICDVGAAPGGKTTHIAERMKDSGEIIAIDRNDKRLELMKQNVDRLGLTSIKMVQSDFLTYETSEHFDRILIDAPCSSLGVLRRRPEAKYKKNQEQITHLAKLQFAMLEKAAELLKPKGVLVYSVCTYTPEETQEVVKRFLNENADFELESLKAYLPKACESLIDNSGTVTILPTLKGMDGFFIARLIR